MDLKAAQVVQADLKLDRVGRSPRRTAAAKVDPVDHKADLATAAVALQAAPAARTTVLADREAQVGPATGVVDRAGPVIGAMDPAALVGRTGVRHPRTKPGVG